MKKSTLSTILTTALFAIIGSFFNCSAVGATEVESSKYDVYCHSRYLDRIGRINRSQTISINGIRNPLYCTFEDKEGAIEDLKLEIPEILTEISSDFKLEEINSDNLEEYKAGLYNLPNENTFSQDTNLQRIKLVTFFDIFENYQKK